MDALWAHERLRECGGSLPADTLKRLVLLATGDEQQADDAWCQRVHEEMKRKNFSARGF